MTFFPFYFVAFFTFIDMPTFLSGYKGCSSLLLICVNYVSLFKPSRAFVVFLNLHVWPFPDSLWSSAVTWLDSLFNKSTVSTAASENGFEFPPGVWGMCGVRFSACLCGFYSYPKKHACIKKYSCLCHWARTWGREPCCSLPVCWYCLYWACA